MEIGLRFLAMLTLLYITPVRTQGVCSVVPDCNCSLTNSAEGHERNDGATFLHYDCRSNGLLVVPNFTGDINVGIIDAADNKIADLHEDTFAHFTELLGLYLPNNLIEILPEKIFAANVELITLHLDDNKIQCLPEKVFAKNVNLNTIYLERNQIQSLPENIFANNVILNDIDLYGNMIQNMSEKIVANHVYLRYISLSVNCNCLSKSVYKFVQPEVEHFFNTYFSCMGSTDVIGFKRVLNCNDSSFVTLYDSDTDSQNCLCEEMTTTDDLEEKKIACLSTLTSIKEVEQTQSLSTVMPSSLSLMSQATHFVALGTSFGSVAGVVAVAVMAVNVMKRQSKQTDIDEIAKMENKEAEKQCEVLMENCEVDFTTMHEAFEREMTILKYTPPVCHLKTFSTSV